MIIKILRDNPDQKFTAWELANPAEIAENIDFHHYVTQVGIYTQTGTITEQAWNQ